LRKIEYDLTMNETKKLREAFGLSQSKFAAKIRASLRTVQAWEQGRNQTPAQRFGIMALRFIVARKLWSDFEKWVEDKEKPPA